jgi:hypothetical protein
VESQIFMGGQAVTLARQAYGSSVQMIVVPPVLKLFANATTDDHFQLIRVNSQVSLIEQRPCFDDTRSIFRRRGAVDHSRQGCTWPLLVVVYTWRERVCA